jgi:(4-(4-[2-(gamma-L-glutamylamino)ethyl]phenoxymethyl)furan-2-yl)methanamine synthase
MTTIIAWDIGGAHLKAALYRDGRIEAVRQVPCTLWLGLDHLTQSWHSLAQSFGQADCHAVTMTGELAEIFPSRQEGVTQICRTVTSLAGATPLRFYAGTRGFLGEADAIQAWQHVASANWHASARWAAGIWRNALFIDIGSTTTDIIPIAGGVPVPRGYTDAERLECGELVYTGVVRTSLMSLAHMVPFAGRWHRVTAENFATTADIYRLTQELAAENDAYPASDGRTKSPEDCRARLARMLGHDAVDADALAWLRVAHYFRERQLRLIEDAVAQVLSAGQIGDGPVLVSAGAGHFLATQAAQRTGRVHAYCATHIPVSDAATGLAGATCLPAVAVAVLAGQDANRP